MIEHLVYALAWASFGLGHSLLAGEPARRALGFGARHRLYYNIFAAVHLLVVLALGRWLIGGDFALGPWALWWLKVVHSLGWVLLFVALYHYDLGRLSGLAQMRAAARGAELAEDEDLRLDGPHRWVRHPAYLGGFLILWGMSDSPFGLATAVWGSLYLLIGTWSEERRLIRLFGESYLAYRRRVPAYLPWRGRAI